MTNAQIAKRLTDLEKTVEELRAKVEAASPSADAPWWETQAGRFKNDPVFQEIVRLGREYRESLRPGHRKVKRDRA
jgi:hypothetical protein